MHRSPQEGTRPDQQLPLTKVIIYHCPKQLQISFVQAIVANWIWDRQGQRCHLKTKELEGNGRVCAVD